MTTKEPVKNSSLHLTLRFLFFVKYEFWFHLSSELKKNNTILISFSSIFRERHHILKSNIGLTTLRKFDHFFVQNDLSQQLLKKANISAVHVIGDTRYDRVNELCLNPQSLPEIEQFIDNTPTLVIGSSWSHDLDIIAPVLNNICDPLKIIIAPHNISPADIKSTQAYFSSPSILYSQLNKLDKENILIIDNIGMLSSIYHLATMCYIGGAFKTGLHNILEAATYGKPVIIGPKHSKFEEAGQLIDLKTCYSISSSEEFETTLSTLYQSEEERQRIFDTNKHFIQAQLGATDHIITYLNSLEL
ncbi:3-deoxy-D-manno-octulosonic acid transferase [Cyclobacteriaceae bacterium]|nr:3-deoxy-D-manno-octulosonic acid transferase [Cyclobacteriaceae bacterium]